MVHCMEGVHRAPIIAALLLCIWHRWSLQRAMDHINKLRNVDFQDGLRGTELRDWVHNKAKIKLSVKELPKPLVWMASDKSRDVMWHVGASAGEQVSPLCTWNQRKAQFKDYVEAATSEAISISKTFCGNCTRHVPASILYQMQAQDVPFRSQCVCYDINILQ